MLIAENRHPALAKRRERRLSSSAMPQKQYDGLTDTELLLLLDMCLSAEKRCDGRIAEATRLSRQTRVAYLKPLKRHYALLREKLLSILHERGRTSEQISHHLSQLPHQRSIEPE